MNTITLAIAIIGSMLDDGGSALLHKLDDPGMAVAASHMLLHKLDDPMPRVALGTVHVDPDGWPPRTLSKAMRPARSEARSGGLGDPLKPPVVVGPARRPAARAPQMWQMKDRRGRTWQDADPAWLRTWVAGQDAIPDAPVATYRYAAPTYGTTYGAGVSCAGGACSTGAGFRLFGR